jgi:hypothetical protein
MQQQSLSPSATRTWLLGVSWQACAAYVCTLLIALALPFWDAIHNRSPDTHPLQFDRLCLRIAALFATALNVAIVGRVVYRSVRRTTRLRNGLCLTCGYDVRANDGCCPECGSPFKRSDAASSVPVNRWQARIEKVFAACDSWQFYLANLIGCGVAAYFFKAPWIRVAIACVALPDLYWMIRRIRKGPTDYGRMFRETDC